MTIRAAALAAALLVLCPAPSSAGPRGSAADGGPLKILASFLPMYVFAKNVVGDAPGVTVDLMLPASLGCPHDYALTPGDMKKIAEADLFIANGRGMEEFLGIPVKKANPGIVVVETAAAVAPIRSRGPGPGGKGGEVNPHTWVSPHNAILQVRAVEKALAAARPAQAGTFRRNADAYAARLDALAADFAAAAGRFRNRNIVTFHGVFDYLARDLGLRVVGLIEETPGQEPSAGEIERLVAAIRASRAAAVFDEPQYPERIAAVVAAEAKVPLRTLDPVSTGSPDPGAYEAAMRRNLAVLVGTLGEM